MGNLQLVNNLVRLFYIYILLPLLSLCLKFKFKNILNIEIRHSLLDKHNFNAFLSDIDLTIIIKQNSSSKEIIQFFLSLKRFLIMLDTPEIYEEQEYALYKAIKESIYWGIIHTLWSIRKINWNYQSLLEDPSEYNTIKKLRSIEISLNKILIAPKLTKNFPISDFKFLAPLNSSKPCIDTTDHVSYVSRFLETNLSNSIQITLPFNEIASFNELMPGEEYSGVNFKLKQSISEYEILTTSASIRIDEALLINSQAKHDWLNKLKKNSHFK